MRVYIFIPGARESARSARERAERGRLSLSGGYEAEPPCPSPSSPPSRLSEQVYYQERRIKSLGLDAEWSDDGGAKWSSGAAQGSVDW